MLWLLRAPLFPAPLAALVARMEVESTIQVSSDQAIFTQAQMQMPQNPFESAIVSPLPEALVHRFPRAIVLRQVAPFGARAQDPENAVEHLAIIPPRAPHTLRG